MPTKVAQKKSAENLRLQNFILNQRIKDLEENVIISPTACESYPSFNEPNSKKDSIHLMTASQRQLKQPTDSSEILRETRENQELTVDNLEQHFGMQTSPIVEPF